MVALVAEKAMGSFFVNNSSSCHVVLLTHAHQTIFVTIRNARIDCTTRVIVIYRPPSSCFITFLEDVSKELLIVAAHPTETIVCGDFNTTYKNTTCTNANNLADLLETSGFMQRVSDVTHERDNILSRGARWSKWTPRAIFGCPVVF